MSMKSLGMVGLSLVAGAAICMGNAPLAHPNIVLIYADDLGYGDISCNGATRVHTPNIDRIAQEGINFSNAHSASATCTPSRYALLTGEYPWRRPGTGIQKGDAALIIDPARMTLPSMLKQAGYRTGVVGKWHLGLGSGNIDWNERIAPGPKEIGFDYSFLIPATGDRVPCVFLENQRVPGLDPADPIQVSYEHPVGHDPTGETNPELLILHPNPGHRQHSGTIVNGISRIGYMSGGKAVRWVDEDIADTLVAKAESFIESSSTEPFFLFFSTHDIHAPRVPNPRFAGQTPMGRRGDAIAELDWCVGEILRTLEQHQLGTNTLVIFSSDNGPVVNDGYADDAVEKLGDHLPAGPLSGGKYTIFEGGTRIPLLMRWPEKINPGSTSKALVCQVDFLASFAAMLGIPLTAGDAPDSFDLLPAFMGQIQTGRTELIEHMGLGEPGPVALVSKDWKYVPAIKKNPEALYNLADDIGEKINLAGEYPERLSAMKATLQRLSAQMPESNPTYRSDESANKKEGDEK